jgi:hypothetical protein
MVPARAQVDQQCSGQVCIGVPADNVLPYLVLSLCGMLTASHITAVYISCDGLNAFQTGQADDLLIGARSL